MHVCKFLAQLLLDESWQDAMDRWQKAKKAKQINKIG